MVRAGLVELRSVVATLSCVREIMNPIEAQVQLVKLEVERLGAMEPVPVGLEWSRWRLRLTSGIIECWLCVYVVGQRGAPGDLYVGQDHGGEHVIRHELRRGGFEHALL